MSTRRQKRFAREARLQSAKKWIASYRGHNLVRGYRKWFGVSDVCAVLELRMLGVDIPDARLEQARRDEQGRAAANARRRQQRTRRAEFVESDETFAFIIDYTEGGTPYGITWEEMEALDAETEAQTGPVSTPSSHTTRAVPRMSGMPVPDEDDSLPF